ncbi:MAG: hypothetical protein L3J89_12710 [Gammaproteobacteria bacterium]|nr:hypothetical protein [Gammaproteobacteria bacterium]
MVYNCPSRRDLKRAKLSDPISMYREKIIVEDSMGLRYRLQLFNSPPLGVSIKAESFSNQGLTASFVARLQVNKSRWLAILKMTGSLLESESSEDAHHQAIARLMMIDRIEVYALDPPYGARGTGEYPTLMTPQALPLYAGCGATDR